MNENTYFSPFALFFLRNLVNAQNLAYITYVVNIRQNLQSQW